MSNRFLEQDRVFLVRRGSGKRMHLTLLLSEVMYIDSNDLGIVFNGNDGCSGYAKYLLPMDK